MGVDQLNHEGSELFRLQIIRRENLLGLSCAIWQGDSAAFTLLHAAFRASARIKRQAHKNPVICLCCPRPVLEPDAALAFLVPITDEPTVVIASALCLRCSAEEPGEIIVRASAAYTKSYPNLRSVEITHPEGGHA
jgi:hypothetical protein